jgi:hypothetical protein
MKDAMSMGNRSKRLKRWKWPLGAAGAILVVIGLNVVKASPEFAAAQAADNVDTNRVVQQTDNVQPQDGADQWMEQRGRHGMRGHRGEMGGDWSFQDNGSSGSGGGDIGSGSGGGFRSSTRTS